MACLQGVCSESRRGLVTLIMIAEVKVCRRADGSVGLSNHRHSRGFCSFSWLVKDERCGLTSSTYVLCFTELYVTPIILT